MGRVQKRAELKRINWPGNMLGCLFLLAERMLPGSPVWYRNRNPNNDKTSSVAAGGRWFWHLVRKWIQSQDHSKPDPPLISRWPVTKAGRLSPGLANTVPQWFNSIESIIRGRSSADYSNVTRVGKCRISRAHRRFLCCRQSGLSSVNNCASHRSHPQS